MKVKTISKIKFDDRAIDKIVVDDLDFSFVDKNGNNKFRRQIIIPFDVPKRSFLKGLKLCIQRDTGSKLFWLLFWFAVLLLSFQKEGAFTCFLSPSRVGRVFSFLL